MNRRIAIITIAVLMSLAPLMPAYAATDSKIIFLHHSTGGNVYTAGNVAGWIANYNTQHQTSYQITERSYPNTPYPWNNYPYDYWNLWVNGASSPSQPGIEGLETLTQNHDIIIYKHCFPGAAVLADTGSPNIASQRKSLENYKLQYRALRAKLDSFPDTVFMVWTLAPLHRLATNAADAARARQFVDWVKSDFLTEDGRTHPNIVIFDFWGIVAGGDNFLKYEYEINHTISDSHPNTLANRTAGPIFAQAIVDAAAAIQTQYTITASAGANGSIAPGGTVSVNSGASQAFTITPDTGYHIADVIVDGISVGAVGSYGFSDVTANRTISASFAADEPGYTLTIDSADGSVDVEILSGRLIVPDKYEPGSKLKLTAHAGEGCQFSGFSGDLDTTLNMRELTMDGNKSVTANFEARSGAVNMDEAWFSAQGQPPYLLTQADTTYVLQTDLTVDATAFVVGAANVTLDLNGYTVTYNNSQPITVTNGGFEQGTGRDVPGWDLSGAPNAIIADNTNYLWGAKVLRMENITGTQTIISDPITIPFANHEYAATIASQGPWDAGVRLSVIDAVTGATLGSMDAPGVERGFSAVVRFTAATTNAVRLKVEVTPASGKTQSVNLDYASLTVSRDYGIVASRAYDGFPAQLRNSAIDNAAPNTVSFAIRNGRILQGQGRGYGSYTMYVQGLSGLAVDNVETANNGIDTCAVGGEYSRNIAIRNSTLRSSVDKISDRMGNYGVIRFDGCGGNVLIEGNHILDAPQGGISVGDGSNIVFRNNTIESNTIVANGYGILLYRVTDFEITGNRITAQPGKSSRGIFVGGVVGNRGEISGNYVDIRERRSPENSGGEVPTQALRLRYYGDAQHRNIQVHDNTFIARTGNAWEPHSAIALRVSYMTNSTGINLGNVIENNTFKAIIENTATGVYDYARAFLLDDNGLNCAPLFRNNVFESNDNSLRIGGEEGGALSGMFLSNTLRRSSEGPIRNYRPLIIGYWTYPIHNVQLIDNRYENGATPAITWIGSGLKDISTGWLLGATIQNSQGQPLQGATLDIFDKDNTLVFTGTSDANGKIPDIPVVTTIYRQEGTNPGVITTDNRTPHHLEVSLVGYDTRTQDISLTESREITLTLGSPASTSRHITSANLNTDPNDELVIDFGTNGIWTYSTTTNTWNTLHPIGSESIIKANLDSDPKDDLVIDFGQYGIWVYSNNSTWTTLHSINPDTITRANLDSNPIDDLVIDFGQYGIWIYSNNSNWTNLHTLNPKSITKAKLDSDNTDELVIDFGQEGVWVYYPNLGTWNKLHTLTSDQIISADIDNDPLNTDDLVVDFGTNGIWVYYNNSTWSQLHALNPDSITRANLDSDPKDDLVIDFGTNGIWIYYNNNTWSQLHALNPESITRADLDSDPIDDLVIDFGTNGIWVYYNNNTWVKIHE